MNFALGNKCEKFRTLHQRNFEQSFSSIDSILLIFYKLSKINSRELNLYFIQTSFDIKFETFQIHFSNAKIFTFFKILDK
jgi:hypothetical protein